MCRFQYEVFLGSPHLSPADWQNFLVTVQRQLGGLQAWELQIHFDHYVLHYYLLSERELPTGLQLEKFLLKPTVLPPTAPRQIGLPMWHRWEDNCIALALQLQSHNQTLQAIALRLSGWHQRIIGCAEATVNHCGKVCRRRIALTAPATLLSVDFTRNQNFAYKKIPKYLKSDKLTRLLQTAARSGPLQIDTFPYATTQSYLQLEQYDFARHSLILGGSGMGKSKFIAQLIRQLYTQHRNQYQVVVIDPHDALKQDLVDIADRYVVDFTTPPTSIDLFATSTQNLSASIELMLGLFQSLIADNYNSRLERVLRFSIYLLSTAQSFTFATLRQLLTDLDYRQQLLQQWQSQLPTSVTQFFLTDFQELKTKSYNEAIAPIIALIDEMQMVPTFSQACCTVGLAETLQDTFLTIFSLNRLQFGDKVVRTLAGLLMQQLFLLAQSRSSERHLLIIIDEVAVVENPILPRFLSELRKYGVSVVLAGQYFAQITPELRQSIFANVPNYYLFRVSRADANLLAQNLEIKLANSEAPEDCAKVLAGLKARECLVQISQAGQSLPIFKATTTDFKAAAAVPAKPIPQRTSCIDSGDKEAGMDCDFALDDVDIGDLLQTISTSRKAFTN